MSRNNLTSFVYKEKNVNVQFIQHHLLEKVLLFSVLFLFFCFLIACLFYYEVALSPSSKLGVHSCVCLYLDSLFCSIGWQICLGAVTYKSFLVLYFLFGFLFVLVLHFCPSNLRLVNVMAPVMFPLFLEMF